MRRFSRYLAGRSAALAAVAAVGLAVATPSLAVAKVRIAVDLDTQTMHVESQDQTFDWKVSTGKAGYETPTGTYGVLWTDKDHHSDEYDQAPMPNSIFFKPGFAIHGFGRSPWGHAASHGCIRLPVAKSAILYDLVKAEGAEITVTGQTPDAVVAERPRREREPAYDEARDDYARYGYGRDERRSAVAPPSYDAPGYDPRADERAVARGYDGYAPQGEAPQQTLPGRDPLFGSFY